MHFQRLKKKVIPRVWKYNGKLLLRIRPTNCNFVQNVIEPPFEIHLVTFDSAQNFEQFQQAKERKSYLNLKEQSIKVDRTHSGKPDLTN